MNNAIKSISIITMGALIGFAGYQFGLNQSTQALRDKGSDLTPTVSVDAPQVPPDFSDQFSKQLDKLKAEHEQMNEKQLAIEQQIKQSRIALESAPDLELLTTKSLPELVKPEQILSASEAQLLSPSDGSTVSRSGAIKNYTVSEQVKSDLKVNTGIAPADVEAAFNIQNLE